MRLFILIYSFFYYHIFCGVAFAQQANDCIEWINTRGEENLRDITGNVYLYWDLDRYGTLKITNHQAKDGDPRNIAKSYTYLNLYELQSGGSLINPTPEHVKNKKLVLQCQPKRDNCIKTRNHFGDSTSNEFATSSFSFNLKNAYDIGKGEKIEKALITAIKIFNGGSAGLE